MSYIRSTSNPEKLYIYGSKDGIEISKGFDYLGRVPQNVFDGLIKKFHKNYHTYPCSYKGAMVDEIIENNLCQTEFTYENIKFRMYDVTWEYIVYSNK